MNSWVGTLRIEIQDSTLRVKTPKGKKSILEE